jgi:hypothetical protein
MTLPNSGFSIWSQDICICSHKPTDHGRLTKKCYECSCETYKPVSEVGRRKVGTLFGGLVDVYTDTTVSPGTFRFERRREDE